MVNFVDQLGECVDRGIFLLVTFPFAYHKVLNKHVYTTCKVAEVVYYGNWVNLFDVKVFSVRVLISVSSV